MPIGAAMSVAIEPSIPSADLGSMMNNVKLHVAHQVPGRVRMKIPSAKGNPELLEEMKQTLSVIPGIEEVIINPATGSLVLHYDTDQHDEFHGHLVHHTGGQHQPPPSNEIDALASKIQQEAEFLAENSHAARVVVDFFKQVDAGIKTGSNNTIDLKIVLAVGIASITILEVGANAATPVWVTLAMFGLNHLIEANRPEGADSDDDDDEATDETATANAPA
jgi:Heavy metal associated domain 2